MSWISDLSANRFNNTYFRDAHGTGFAVDMSGDLIVRGQIRNDDTDAVDMSGDLIVRGNVGIGITSPTNTLDVDGGIKVKGTGSNVGLTMDNVFYIRRKGNGVSYSSYDHHAFYSNSTTGAETGSERMRITSSGNVGIGTSSPACSLEVRGASGTTNSTYTRYNSFNFDSTSLGGFTSNTAISSVSVYAYGNLGCSNYIFSHNGGLSASDVRIKTNITDVQDDEALSLLRSLKPKTYSYKDVMNRGTDSVYGFIAQEVGETISMSTFTKTETIPNIYQLATVGADKKTICFYQGFNTSDLDSSSNILQITDMNEEEHFVNIEEIIDVSYIRVDTDLSNMMGDVDESGNIIEGNKVFVYGQRVDDFNFLRKDAIWTVATAALQEVDRQLQAEKAKVADLEAKTATLESQVAALLAKYPVD